MIYRPSGAFRSLSLGNLLLPESGTEVITQFEVMRITSVYDFIQSRFEKPALLDLHEGSAVVFANPDFDGLNFTEMGSTGHLETRNGISPLPFTETEAEVVADILINSGLETKVFLGAEASELNFKPAMTFQLCTWRRMAFRTEARIAQWLDQNFSMISMVAV